MATSENKESRSTLQLRNQIAEQRRKKERLKYEIEVKSNQYRLIKRDCEDKIDLLQKKIEENEGSNKNIRKQMREEYDQKLEKSIRHQKIHT